MTKRQKIMQILKKGVKVRDLERFMGITEREKKEYFKNIEKYIHKNDNNSNGKCECDKCGKVLDKLENEDIFVENSREVFCEDCYIELEEKGIMRDFERVKGEKGDWE